jgi:hypothetical protein
LFLLQSQESLFVVARDDAAASLALEVLEALGAAEPVERGKKALVTILALRCKFLILGFVTYQAG